MRSVASLVIAAATIVMARPDVQQTPAAGAPAGRWELVVLGVAQDGGIPHLNCQQDLCRSIREGKRKAERVASLGLLNRQLGKAYVFDATPDFPSQLHSLTGGLPDRLDELVRNLAMIGLDGMAGWFGEKAIVAWAAAGHALVVTPTVTPEALAAERRNGEPVIIDVRGAAEWKAGHMPGVVNIPLGYLPDHLAELPADRPIVTQCQGGGRSVIAASLLEAHGIRGATNLTGGFGAWEKAGLPVER